MSTTTELGSGAMFDRIAHRYDLLNRLMSFGLDRAWRRRQVGLLAAPLARGARVLDLATGTGDVAIEALRQRPDLRVVGLDPSPRMLACAAAKCAEIEWVEGDAQRLGFPDASFDGASMSFGIRNVPDRDAALREIRRVLAPGARLVLMELNEPTGLLAWPARIHIRYLVPLLGAALVSRAEYDYLQRSIRAFPPPEGFAAQLRAAGFVEVEWHPVMFGVATLFVGVRPAQSEGLQRKIPPP